ncbi:hypothetical protein HK104_007545, partial [Borealophlyctis nickersoniae]
MHPDDAKDKVFTAIVKGLLKVGNRPCTPKELSGIILKHKFTNLGGNTPYATVSSRISQHFKRTAEYRPAPRPPLLGRRPMDMASRRLRYFVNQAGVPVHDDVSGDLDIEGDDGLGVDVEDGSSPLSPTGHEGGTAPAGGGHQSQYQALPYHQGPTRHVEAPTRSSSRVKRKRSTFSPDPGFKRSRSGSFSGGAGGGAIGGVRRASVAESEGDGAMRHVGDGEAVYLSDEEMRHVPRRGSSASSGRRDQQHRPRAVQTSGTVVPSSMVESPTSSADSGDIEIDVVTSSHGSNEDLDVEDFHEAMLEDLTPISSPPPAPSSTLH